MKFALISQAFIVQSYKVINGKAYTLDGKPYQYNHSIGNEFFIGFWLYPFLFDGYYLNISDIDKVDEDFDIILLANDSKNIAVSTLRQKYPNAFILASVKEMNGNEEVRRDLFKQADALCTPLGNPQNPFNTYFQSLTDRKFHWIPQPVNIDYIQNNFYEGKTLSIFSYQHQQPPRSANSKQVSYYLGNKYKIPVYEKFTDPSYKDNQLKIHTEVWSKCLFMVNMDPTFNYGQQSTLCAAAGTIMIGGNNDANYFLYPSTNTTNIEVLDKEIKKIISEEEYRNQIMQYAFDKVNEYYSYDSIKNKILNLIK